MIVLHAEIANRMNLPPHLNTVVIASATEVAVTVMAVPMDPANTLLMAAHMAAALEAATAAVHMAAGTLMAAVLMEVAVVTE